MTTDERVIASVGGQVRVSGKYSPGMPLRGDLALLKQYRAITEPLHLLLCVADKHNGTMLVKLLL